MEQYLPFILFTKQWLTKKARRFSWLIDRKAKAKPNKYTW